MAKRKAKRKVKSKSKRKIIKKKATKKKPIRKKIVKKTTKNVNKNINKNIVNVKISNQKSKTKRSPKKWTPTPLKGSFMALAIVGFLITVYIVYPISFNFGIAFMTIFIVMFIASLISMGQAPLPK